MFLDGTEREVHGSYYPYPSLPPPPPPPPHYLPVSRPSSTPPYPSPLYAPPTPPPVTPPPTPEQYQQMWQHFNNFYAYYYQQPPAQFYYPPPPPYPGSNYSFTYPSDTEDGYSGYSSTEEMNGYFNNLHKQRYYQQQMRGAQIESVENSETEYETSDTEKPNEYQVKLYDESEEDTEYPMTTSIESADSVVGDYLSTIVEESEVSDRKSQCSDCTLEKLSDDEDEIKSDEEVVFVKLPLNLKRKNEVTTIVVGNASKAPSITVDEGNKEGETESAFNTIHLMPPEIKMGEKNFASASRSNKSSDQNGHVGEKDQRDIGNTFVQDYDKNSSKSNQQKPFSTIINDDEEKKFIETYEEKKVKEKRIKNTETKISIVYNGVKDEKIVNAVKKRSNKSTKSVFTSRLSGENFEYDCWSESDVNQQEEVTDPDNKQCNKSNSDKWMNLGQQKTLVKQSIITHDLSTDDNEPNISVTIKFPFKINMPQPKNGVLTVMKAEEVVRKSTKKCSDELTKNTDTSLEEMLSSPGSSRCETPCEENSQESERSQDNSERSSKTSEEECGTHRSFLQNLSSILQNIKMSRSMEKEELGQTLETQEESTMDTNEIFQHEVTKGYVNSRFSDILQEKVINITDDEYSSINSILETSPVSKELNKKVDVEDKKSDEVDFWAEIGQSEDHMHLSMTNSQIDGFEIAPETSNENEHDVNLTEKDLMTAETKILLDESDDIEHEAAMTDGNSSDDEESSESDGSESKSKSSEDSTGSEDSTSSTSSCEEDEEEGRTFVFYHDNERKEKTFYNDLSPPNPPEIRIHSNDDQQPESYPDDINIINYPPVFEDDYKVKCEENKYDGSSTSSEHYNSYEIQETNENTEITNHNLDVQGRRRSSQYLDESEDDSGVTSDISRHISETDTDHDQEYTELKKMSAYKRANTHSRLYQLLQDECDFEKVNTSGETSVPIKERLSLPLSCSSIDNSNVSTPTSPVVSEKLVKELVQSLLNKKKGRIFRNLPIEKLHAAAIRILQEDVDYDTFSSTSGESSLLESPADHSPVATPLTRANHKASGAYSNYTEYYDTWANANIRESLGSDIIPSRAFRILQEHVKPGIGPGFIEGLQAKCPKVSSATNLPSVLEVRDSLTPVPENNP